MPGKRIPALTSLTGANSATNDEVVIFDTSANGGLGETKRITRAQLAAGLVGDLPYTPAGFIAASTVPTAIAEIASDLAAAGGAALVGNTPAGTIAATTVQGAINEIVSDLAASSGSSLVGFLQAGTSATARTVQAKLRDVVSVKDFGAVGNGIADDTVAIQAALNSGAKQIVFSQGATFLIDGGLTLATAGTTITATGATIKLKANAASLSMLYISGNDCVVDGGTWDGNKANGNVGTWGSASYSSFNVAMYADRCTVKNIKSVNTWGMAVKGFGNQLSALNCQIYNTQHYGIFFDGSNSVSHSGNRACGNTIDMSEGQIVSSANQGQGILFTAGSGQAQTNWELSGNYIIGPQTSVTDQAINLAVRGNDGVVANNTTRHGAMGFSEGGSNCAIVGNCFLELKGSVRIGIEPSGKFVASGNVITDAYVGVDCTATVAYDESCVANNTITVASGGSSGVRFQTAVAQTSHNVAITGNTITTPSNGVYLTRDCSGALIAGNTIVGPGIGAGRGVFLDTPPAAAFVSIVNNVFRDFLTSWSVYSASAATFTDLFAANNMCANVGSSQLSWDIEGSAVIGARAAALGTSFGARDTFDVAGNIFRLTSDVYNNPNGGLAAGIGSVHISKNSGGGIYFKRSGSGNTGWMRLDLSETATAADIAAVGSAINTTGKYAGQLVWDTTNTRMMRASGSAAADPWVVIDGSASVTPS